MLLLLFLLIKSHFSSEYFGKINILVMGQTISCKHYLINELFQEELIPADIDKDTTKNIQFFTKDGYPMTMYNTPSINFETSQYKKDKKTIINYVKKLSKTNDPKKFVHCILYCVKCSTYQLDENEIEYIKEITTDPTLKDIPIIIVIIQNNNHYNGKRTILHKNIKKLNLSIFDVVPIILKKKLLFFPSYINYGLSHLMKTIMNSTSIIKVDNHGSMISKRVKASASIAAGTLAASYIGYKNIPVSKFYILTPIEKGMVLLIQNSYGIQAPMNFIDCFIDWALTHEVAKIKELITKKSNEANDIEKNETSSFNSIKSKILSYFYEGPIASAVSGIITASIGGVYMNIMEKAYKNYINFGENYTNSYNIINFVKPLFEEYFNENQYLKPYLN